ncbi:MAG: S-layer homology domain-containing protein, partial [Clostridia bacterium]|nr:S-layer homology domain-containing protein [Clostridia bacterium]
MTKKFLSLLTAVVFMLSAAPSVLGDGAPASFTDVDPDAWYAEYVEAVCERGIMTGKGGGIFDPEGNVTRAEFVTVLKRLSGDGDAAGTASFSDVA